jgi:glycosyltransferase involved in cell wall biosynthesis
MSYRLGIVDPLSRHGGMHYYIHDQAVALGRLGVETTVFAPPTGLDPEGGYRQHELFEGVYGADPKPVRAARLLRDYARTVARAKADRLDGLLFHIFKSDGFEASAIAMARAAGLHAYSLIHDVARLDADAAVTLVKPIGRLSTGVIVHNDFSRAALLSAAPGVAGKTRVIPHGNYVDRFPDPPEMERARDALGLPQDRTILLFFGNPRREKGLHVLTEALVSLRDRRDVLLLVAGKMKPEEEAEVRGFVAAHGLGDIVRLDIGHIADDRVPDYYRAASIVVLPYLRVYESGVALMAMSFGRPILASDLPVFQGVVAESGAGVTFPAGDAAALGEAIASLAGRDDELAAMGARARRFAEEERSWARSGALLADLLAQAKAGTVTARR